MSPECVDQLRFRFSIDLPSEPRDIDFDDIAELFPVKVVEMFQELALGDDNSWAMHQVFEHPVLHRRKRESYASPSDDGTGHIHLQAANRQPGVCVALAAPDQSLQTSSQLFEVEGFG